MRFDDFELKIANDQIFTLNSDPEGKKVKAELISNQNFIPFLTFNNPDFSQLEWTTITNLEWENFIVSPNI